MKVGGVTHVIKLFRSKDQTRPHFTPGKNLPNVLRRICTYEHFYIIIRIELCFRNEIGHFLTTRFGSYAKTSRALQGNSGKDKKKIELN